MKKIKTALQTLECMRRWFSKPNRLIKGHNFLYEGGVTSNAVADNKILKCCLDGCIIKYGDTSEIRTEIRGGLMKVLQVANISGIAYYNDEKKTKQKDILNTIEKTKKLIKKGK